MKHCCWWEARPRFATAGFTIHFILSAETTCHGARGGKTYPNIEWDHMMACQTHFEHGRAIECPAIALNARGRIALDLRSEPSAFKEKYSCDGACLMNDSDQVFSFSPWQTDPMALHRSSCS